MPNNEPITCRKCAHVQFSGTHCDFCGTSLKAGPDKPKRELSKFTLLRIAGFAGILVVSFLIRAYFHKDTAAVVEPPPVTIFPAQQAAVLNKVMQTAADANKSDAPTGASVFAKAAPGIVTLYQDDDKGKPKHVIGAGFLLDETTIATSYHSVHGINNITAMFADDTKRPALRMLGTSQQHDIALLSIDKIDDSTKDAAIDSLEAASRQLNSAASSTTGTSHKHTATSGLDVGRTAATNIGDTVIAAGSAKGIGGSVTQGIVTQMTGGLIKTNLPVSDAWSGGPLLNMQGEVVGMLTSQPPGGVSGNYALPIEWATALLMNPESTPLGNRSTPAVQSSASRIFGPYSFKLAAQQKRTVPFTTPNDLESAQFSARLTGPGGTHLHLTITRQGHVLYDSGDTAGAKFTLSLKRGDYVMLVENSGQATDVSITGTFSNDL